MSSSNYYMRPQDREGGNNSVGRGYHQSSSRSRGGRSRDRSLDIHDHQRDMSGEARRRRSGDGYHHNHHSSSRYRSYDDEPRASGHRYQEASSSSSRDDYYHQERDYSSHRRIRSRSPDPQTTVIQNAMEGLTNLATKIERRSHGVNNKRRPLGSINGAEMQRAAPHPMTSNTSNGSQRDDNVANLNNMSSHHQKHHHHQPQYHHYHPMNAYHGRRDASSRQDRPQYGQVRRMQAPQFNKINDIPKLIQTTYSCISAMCMSPPNTAAFWNSLAKQVGMNNQLNLSYGQMRFHINQLFQHTRRTLEMFGPKDLTQTTLSMAKLADLLRKRHSNINHRKDGIASSLSNLLLNDDATINKDLFLSLANASVRKIDQFNARHISNLAYAYALIEYVPKSDDNGSDVFDHIAMQSIKMRAEFNPQEISNMVWAFATVDKRHDIFFKAMGDQVVAQDHLGDFKPQELSNTVWAYATAGEVSHPQLFKKVGDHIVQLDHLRNFKPQALSNTVWAYATAQVSHPKMFQQVAKAAIQCKDGFNPQGVSNLLWSYATMGIIDKQLFSLFVPTAAELIDKYNNQGLANIAWAYAVADVDAPTLFNGYFINECLEKKDGFSIENLNQLHQWHLWQTKEKKSRTGLPEELQDRCYNASISRVPCPSKFQDDVVDQLSSIGLDPKEEVLLDSGYRIDALVEVNGKTIGVEVDGPSHFIGRSKSPLAKTILKRRQVPSIDGIELVSVPYWEWNQLGKSQTKKQEYLRQLLNL